MNSAYRLFVEQGPDKGREFVLPDDGADIGRSDQNALVLADAELSRRHCRLDFRDGVLWVADLASANGTFVNGREVQETPLRVGDRLAVGASVLRLDGPGGSAPDAPPTPVAPVDLGLGGGAAAPAENAPRRPLAWAIAALLIIVAAALAAKLILETPTSNDPVPERRAPQPRTLALRYERLEADLGNIFRYEARLSADGSLAVEIDDLRQSRHVRRESDKPVSPELLAELTRMIEQSGVLALDERYEGIPTPGTATEADLLVAIGHTARHVRVANRAEPEEFREARERIETFVRNEFGLWAVEYSAEQLRDMALDNLLVGQRLLAERDIQPGNLHEACRRYRECLNLLETVDPKPDFHADALRDLREAEGLLADRFRELNFAADRAIKLREWPQAAESLRELMRLIPDRSDDRHRDAERRLLDVEQRLRKHGGRS